MLPLSGLIQPAGSGIDGSGATILVNPTSSTANPNYVTFRKADNSATGTHGGPAPTYPNSVTLQASVAINGVPTRLTEGRDEEPRPLARTIIKITTHADPATYLGSRLATNDLVDWGGQTYIVSGSSIYQAGSYLTVAEIDN